MGMLRGIAGAKHSTPTNSLPPESNMSQDPPVSEGRAAFTNFMKGGGPFAARDTVPGVPVETTEPARTPAQMEVDRLSAEIASHEREAADVKNREAAWLDALSAVGLTASEAIAIQDSVLLMGQLYTQTVRLWDKVDVTFTMRRSQSGFTLSELLEDKRPWAQASFNLMVAQSNLLHSLKDYGGRHFDPSTPDGRAATNAFLQNVPDVVYNRLVDALAAFDQRVSVIFAPGSVRDF